MQAYSSFSAVFVERSGNSCRSLLARFLFNVEKQISTATVNLRKNKEESDEGEDEGRRTTTTQQEEEEKVAEEEEEEEEEEGKYILLSTLLRFLGLQVFHLG